jgi:small-conductance mechanosensitive channel
VRTRFHINVGVAYGSDVKLVEKVLLECAKGNHEITEDPAPFVRFIDFGNSSLDFQLFFWTNNTFKVENIKSDFRFSIDKKFRENNIAIPFPQRDVHIKSKS